MDKGTERPAPRGPPSHVLSWSELHNTGRHGSKHCVEKTVTATLLPQGRVKGSGGRPSPRVT